MFLADLVVGQAVCVVDGVDHGNQVLLLQGEVVSAELHTAQ